MLGKGEKKSSRARSLALYGDALLAFRQGKVEESHRRGQAALDTALSADDPEALTLANLALARVALETGDYAQSIILAVKAREFGSNLGLAMGQAPLFIHASATRMTGNYDQAAALFEQSLNLNRQINDQGMVIAELQNLGWVEVHRGNIDKAERCFTESEKLESTSDPYGAAMNKLSQAFIAFARGDKNKSRTLFERAQSMFEEAKMDPGPDDQFEINWLSDQLKSS